MIRSATSRWAELIGHRVHLIVTSHPIGTEAWAKQLWQNPNNQNRLPDVAGAETAHDWLTASQNAINVKGIERTHAFLGVRITDRDVNPADLVALRGRTPLTKKLDPIRRDVNRVIKVVAGEGWSCRPLTAAAVGWLMHSGSALGLPIPQETLRLNDNLWDGHALTAISETVRSGAAEWGNTVQVAAIRDGRPHRHHVSVITAKELRERDTNDPEQFPWFGLARNLPFGVSFSAIFDVHSGAQARADAEYNRRRAGHLITGFLEHGESPPRHAERAAEDAARIEDEVGPASTKDLSCRLAGVVRAAVWGDTEDEATERAAEFIKAYADELDDEWVVAFNQWATAREFIPGEPRVCTGHDDGFFTVMPAYYAAAGVPNVDTGLGDDTGPLYAQSAGIGREPYFLDAQWGPQHGRSGVCVIVGDIGSGKTTAGTYVIEQEVRLGHQAGVVDPAGQIALHKLPHLAPHTRWMDLSSMDDGVLNPGTLIPEPRRAHYDSDREWIAAAREADGERAALMVDSLVMFLPHELLVEGQARYRVKAAVAASGGRYGSSPWDVVAELERSEHATDRHIAAVLRVEAQTKGGILLFPNRHDAPVESTNFDAPLTVLGLRGMSVPDPRLPAEQWTEDQRRAVPVMHLAGRFMARLMYQDRLPKALLTDELGISAAGGGVSFAGFLTRGSLETRRWNTWFGVLGQNPSHFTGISEEIENLIGMAMIGRLTNPKAAIKALELLGVDDGFGYHKTPLALSPLIDGENDGVRPRQFLIRDWLGRVAVREINLDHRPHIKAGLSTSPVEQHTPVSLDGIEFTRRGALT
ncbi:MAG: ATP-binding protein [Phycicoccus sp.]